MAKRTQRCETLMRDVEADARRWAHGVIQRHGLA